MLITIEEARAQTQQVIETFARGVMVLQEGTSEHPELIRDLVAYTGALMNALDHSLHGKFNPN
jgi:hypothetical protein